MTKYIDCRVTRFIPLWNRIRNIRDFMVDMAYKALVGELIIKITHPKG